MRVPSVLSIEMKSVKEVCREMVERFTVKMFEVDEEIEVHHGTYEGAKGKVIGTTKTRKRINIRISSKKGTFLGDKKVDTTSVRRFIYDDIPDPEFAALLEKNTKLNNCFRDFAEELMKNHISPRSSMVAEALWVAMTAKGE